MEKIGQHLRKIRQKSKISLKDVYKKQELQILS